MWAEPFEGAVLVDTGATAFRAGGWRMNVEGAIAIFCLAAPPEAARIGDGDETGVGMNDMMVPARFSGGVTKDAEGDMGSVAARPGGDLIGVPTAVEATLARRGMEDAEGDAGRGIIDGEAGRCDTVTAGDEARGSEDGGVIIVAVGTGTVRSGRGGDGLRSSVSARPKLNGMTSMESSSVSSSSCPKPKSRAAAWAAATCVWSASTAGSAYAPPELPPLAAA